MRIGLFAVGRLKTGPEKDLAARYLDRLAKAGPAIGMDPPAARESRWTRFLLSIMGPPQLGDVRSPVRASAPDLDVCPRCGHLQVEHATVRTARATILRCPDGAELKA